MKFYRSRPGFVHIGFPFLFLIIILTVSPCIGAEIIHHELQVKLQPEQGSIAVVDDVQLHASDDSAEFSLRSSLTVNAVGADLTSLGESEDDRLRSYRINRLPADGKVQLIYEGKIISGGSQGPFDMPESVLSPDGVYLDGGSAWVPRFAGYPMFTFRLSVESPQDWEVISQGKRQKANGHYIFDMPHPQDDIYLLGGRYERFARMHDGTEIAVYLFSADAELAESYLQASAEYISLYSDWIGAYPYAKFAVVENQWQTGYGMPSFTLLGSRVIRLPFILYTSLPHEVLHNWWGNGIYIDFSSGNWSEGLTAYMSDHLSNERQGKDSEYRRKALERYANFAAEQRDFALTDFSSRHDEASQAVGYSKSMMLFHMLRMQSGNEVFNENIKRLWQLYQFKPASFIDVIKQLYPGSEAEYSAFVEQWLNRPGAPEIALGETIVSKQDNDYILSLEIMQQQQGPNYLLHVPLEVTLEGKEQPVREHISLSEDNKLITLKYKQRPLALTLDPDYDVFRLLHPDERPATLGRLFGAKKQLLVLPSAATEKQLKAWQQLAAVWSNRYDNIELVRDDELKALPDDSAVWLLDWQNILVKNHHERFASTSQRLSGQTVTIDGQQLDSKEHAVVLLDPDNTRAPLGFIGAQDPEAIVLLATKLTHYSSYGALAFKLPEVNNIIKQHLPVLVSPMARQLDN